VNYYQHHIGDYAAATAYLSLVEDAIYTRLLRVYYRDEKPLPCETKAVAWLIGLRTNKERALLENLLSQFFDLQEDGWHNLRADEEISTYREKQEKAKAAIDARWGKAKEQAPEHTDTQDLNVEQDTPEQRAAYDRDTDVLPAKYGRTTDVLPTNNHKPLTNNQEPDLKEPTPGVPPVVGRAQAHATPTAEPPVDNFEKTEGLAEHPVVEPEKPQPVSEAVPAKPDKPPKAERKKSELAQRMLGVDDVVARGAERQFALDWLAVRKAKGVGLTQSELEANVREAASAGISFAQAVQLCAENSWRGFKAMYLHNLQNRNLPHARASPRVNGALAAMLPSSMEQAFSIAERNLFGVVIDEPV